MSKYRNEFVVTAGMLLNPQLRVVKSCHAQRCIHESRVFGIGDVVVSRRAGYGGGSIQYHKDCLEACYL